MEDTATYKPTNNKTESAELGRKYTDTKENHLRHLLNIGWDKNSPLIRKYVRKNHLEKELSEYVGQ